MAVRVLRAVAALPLMLVAVVVEAQSGAIAGTISDNANGEPLANAVIVLEGSEQRSMTGPDGRYRIRSVRAGRHTVLVRLIGYRPVRWEAVVVSEGRTVTLDFELIREAIELPDILAEGRVDRLLDPRVTQTVQRIGSDEFRELPVTTLAEAIVLQAGVVEGSFRGGRLGQESFVIDGLNVKNQLDASTSDLGLNIPTFALEEASLITNGFSARYGQALSGIITVVTKDGGRELEGSIAYETDRPFGDGWDVGLDRFTASLGGPLIGGIRFYVALDGRARLDDDPVNAPPAQDPLDPRSQRPWLLPHNSGEHYDGLAKLTIPLGNHTLRLMGVASETNRLLFDPELKYSPDRGPAQGTSGRLGLLHWQSFSSPGVRNNTFVFDLRLGYFQKNAIRAPLQSALDREFGAFTFSGFDFAGRAVAAAMDSVSALEPIPGFRVPGYSLNSPWGVPAFFRTDQTRGELARNRFSEVKVQVDLLIGRGLDTDVRVGGQYVQQSVETFTRLESYRSVADGAPEPVLSAFEPFSAAAYAEIQQRVEELSLTAGIRVDGFNSRGGLESGSLKSQWAVSPRFALSTELRGATVVASMGRFAQAPDFQFLVDAAFDDTTRTGRFRRGNPSLGFETSWQYEFSVRYRPLPSTGVRVGAFVKQLDGLVSSVPIGIDPDSSIFANADFGRVRGVEATIEREFINGIGARATYVIQEATASASDAFDFFRRFQVTPLGDTIVPASVSIPLDFDRRHSFIGVLRGRTSPALGRWLGRIEVAMVGRWGSGLPFTSTNVTGDTILGLPNSERLPSQFKLDIVLRKTLNIGGIGIGFYADIRNLTNRRNIVAVRKDTGSPDPGEPQIETMATTAFRAHPEPIPFESPRYTRSFDADGNGLIENAAELMPLFRRAARDFLQGIFAYAPPRLIKLGTEIFF